MMKADFIGSDDLMVSTANMEIIPPKPEGWTSGYNFIIFALFNDQPCRVSINGSKPIYFKANQGFYFPLCNMIIESFVIIDEGITFNWIGLIDIKNFN